MLIDVKKFSFLPACLTFVLFVYSSLILSAMDGMQLVSYATLGIIILGFLCISTIYFRSNEVTLYDFAIISFFALLIAFTCINLTSLRDAVYTTAIVLTLLMMMNYYQHNMRILIYAAFIALSFAVYLNFVYMLKNPTWLAETDKEVTGYILGGNYNQMGGRMLCAIVTGFISVKFSKWWLFNLIPLIIISLTSVFLVSSTTSFVCISLFIIVAIIPTSFIQMFAAVSLSIVVFLFQIFVVFSGKGVEENPVLVYIIEDLMQKDLTFTNRTTMWDSAKHT